jgi:hypothetical protein
VICHTTEPPELSSLSRPADEGKIARTIYNFVPINNLSSIEPGKMLDVVGIVTTCGTASSLTVSSAPCRKPAAVLLVNTCTFMQSKSGKELFKKEIYLADMSGAQVSCTLWNERANLEVNVSVTWWTKQTDCGV